MTTDYKWYINSMETYPEFQGYSYFVAKVSWRYNATNDSGYTAYILGQTIFNEPEVSPENPYVEYSGLTEEEVIIWLDTHEDIITLRENLDSNIYSQMNPIILNLPLPW